jgi:1,4-dihydroxy-2-naphthoate octaprenyltransferase
MPSMKSENPITHASPSVPKIFFLASRPKTWIASISPVLIGFSMVREKHFFLFFLTLLFSVFIQIGTNYANDYFDYINGADTPFRNGPKRATQEGWIQPRTMWLSALAVFGCALIIAIPLMIQAGRWSFPLAALCIAFGILYTGGPKPLGYLGLGECLVFLFFGPIATCGTYFLQTGTLHWPVWIASLSPGFLSCSILIANNLRDENTDRLALKRTLVVRFGRTFGKWEYIFSIVLAALIPPLLVFKGTASPYLLLASLILLPALSPIRKVLYFRDPLELIAVLQNSAFLLLLYTLLFTLFV